MSTFIPVGQKWEKTALQARFYRHADRPNVLAIQAPTGWVVYAFSEDGWTTMDDDEAAPYLADLRKEKTT